MRWRLGIRGDDESMERGIEAVLAKTIAETQTIDAAVILAFDAVYDDNGRLDGDNTHLYVTLERSQLTPPRHHRQATARLRRRVFSPGKHDPEIRPRRCPNWKYLDRPPSVSVP
ncbi:MAG TPA: hypothetical protein VHY37_07440 [Tepidisphaeraceae bacterium]|jgi:hypothetical protein|nr:hypothetical protein [Tepidisphaeraceae bacterium]